MSAVQRLAPFLLISLLWLPIGVLAFSVFRGVLWPLESHAWMSLVVLSPFGLPLALACRKLWLRGHPIVSAVAFLLLAPLTSSSSIFAGLLGPVAIAVYAAIISTPAWLLYYLLRRL